MKSDPLCPICKNALSRHDSHFPFCSERCRLLDLGAWASGQYAIPAGPQTQPEEELPEEYSDEG